MYTYTTAVLCVVTVFCEAAFVDTLTKCSVKDDECNKNTLQRVLRDESVTGIPEVNIAPFDPIILKNIAFPVLNVVNLTIVEGTVKGLRSCVVNKFKTNIEKGKSTMDMTCDLTLKGHYKAFASGPVVNALLGGETVRGDGNAKLKIDKLNLRFTFNFNIQNKNGDTYFISKDEKMLYKYNVQRISIAADNLYIDNKESSAVIIKLLNDNWKLILDSAGDGIMDKAMDAVKIIVSSFFDNIPTKYFILEDLTPFVSY